MKFIELTLIGESGSSGPILVNVAAIAAFTNVDADQSSEVTFVTMIGDPEPMSVRQSPEKIMSLIFSE